MKGYKLLDNNLFDIHYNKLEIGKEYFLENPIKLNKRGFHFCNTIEDTFIYNSLMENSSVYEIDTLDGEVIVDEYKSVSSKMKIIREVPLDEVKKYIEDNLERLVVHDHCLIRAEIAKLGYGLSMFLYDKDWNVRIEVARHKHGLDVLVNDENELVRREVAFAGYGLDQLENDPDFSVRVAVDMVRNNKI